MKKQRKWKIDHIDPTQIDQGLDMDTNIVNIKSLNMIMLTCISNT